MRIPIDRIFTLLAGACVALCVSAPSYSAVCNGAQQFGPATNFTVGSNPPSLASGDLNGDGKLDLVVTVGGGIAVLLGHGNGTFDPAVFYSVSGSTDRVTLGDLNGDGITDVATACFSSNQVGVLLGNGSGGVGNGTFAAPHYFPANGNPKGITSGDFNGDGKLDVAVANNAPGGGGASVLYGNGAGSLGPPTFYALPNQALIIVCGDLNNDGRLDLAVADDFSGAVGVLFGQPSGTFAPPVMVPAGQEPFGVSIADWNGDGIADMMVANGNSAGLMYVRGLGSGNFAAPVLVLPGNCGASVPLDVNGDGKLDIVSALTNGSSSTSVEVALGNGNGTFGAATFYPVGLIPASIVAGDFDGSGKPDLAVANFGNNYVSILLGACDPNSPLITSVRDVPNDQGGKVFLTWTRSALDVSGGAVTSYRVWKEIPSALAQARLRREPSAASVIRAVRASRTSTEVVYWEALATLPAQRLAGYGYTAATPQDSLPGSNPYSVFYITAATNSPDVFYDSAPDSGYSVDNLPPFAPQGMVATLGVSGADVHWNPNGESDLAGYRLYRGNSPGFTPSPANLVVALSDTHYSDAAGGPGTVYKLVAVDVHGNASAVSTASVDGPTAATATALPPVVASDAVALTWQVEANAPITIERTTGAETWSVLATVTRDGDDRVRWTDRTVTAGQSYRYRLSIPDGGSTIVAGEIAVRVPGYELALAGVSPNPLMQGAFAVRFTLGSDRQARLDVLDIGGRRVASVDVGALGAGPHLVNLDLQRRIPAGLYVIRLSSSTRVLSTKAIVMR